MPATPTTPTTIVPLTAADSRRLLDVDQAAFFFDPNSAPGEKVIEHFDWDRTYAATLDGAAELAGVYTSYDMAVTVLGPGASLTRLPMAGLSWVSVHPDQRRRGVLTAMMRHHLDDLHDQGAVLGGLHAAEVGIYGRFGYGTSSLDVTLTLARGTTLAAPGLDEAAAKVRTRFVPGDDDEVSREIHELHLRCAETTLGAVTRPDRMARLIVTDMPKMREGREPRQVMFATVDGERTGYAIFSRKNNWEDALPQGVVNVDEIAATGPASMLALVRRMLDFDLTVKTEIGSRSADDPIVWWAGGPRGLGVKVYDALWLRLVDVGAAMTARGYAAPCDVVFEVVDDFCPWNAGAWRLTVGQDGMATCEPSSEEASVRLPVQALGAAYLGSRSLVSQADLGGIDVQDRAALRSLSRAMRADREPVGAIQF